MFYAAVLATHKINLKCRVNKMDGFFYTKTSLGLLLLFILSICMKPSSIR